MRQYAAFPPPAFAGQEASLPIFPQGSTDWNRPSSAASVSLNATVYLLNEYEATSARSSTGTPATAAGRIRSALSNPAQGPPVRSAAVAMSSTLPPSPRRRKLCFVTVGATAPFDDLIGACQTPKFLSALQTAGYTNLLIQHGHKDRVEPDKQVDKIKVTSFDFRKDGIAREMMVAKADLRRVKAEERDLQKREASSEEKIQRLPGLDLGAGWQDDRWEEGVVVSHAGSGSILDALRLGVPTIVVPNERLLDNHQVELAEELAKQGYVAHGHLDDLAAALHEAELIRQKRRQWPPPVDRAVDPGGKGLIGVMDEEMGYRDLKGVSLRSP